MALEERLEALERSMIMLNKTLNELISLYVDVQTNPLIGDLPKNVGFVPTIIKDRNARRAAKQQTHYTLPQMRSIMTAALKIFDIPTMEALLSVHNATCLADMPEDQYYSFAQTLLSKLDQASKS